MTTSQQRRADIVGPLLAAIERARMSPEEREALKKQVIAGDVSARFAVRGLAKMRARRALNSSDAPTTTTTTDEGT